MSDLSMQRFSHQVYRTVQSLYKLDTCWDEKESSQNMLKKDEHLVGE